MKLKTSNYLIDLWVLLENPFTPINIMNKKICISWRNVSHWIKFLEHVGWPQLDIEWQIYDNNIDSCSIKLSNLGFSKEFTCAPHTSSCIHPTKFLE